MILRRQGLDDGVRHGSDRLWRVVYATTLITLFLPLSWLPLPTGAAFGARFVGATVLTCITWYQAGRPIESGDTAAGRHVRWLLVGIWSTLALSASSMVWSEDWRTTALQSVSLFPLCATVHGLAKGRWRSPNQVTSDMSVAVFVAAAIATAGLGAYLLGLTQASGIDGRLSGLYSNPNASGVIAGLALSVLVGSRRCRSLGTLVLGVPLSATVVLSESRTAALGLAVALVVYVLSRARRTAEVAYFTLLGSAAIALFLPGRDLLSGSGLASRMLIALESDDPLSGRGGAWWIAYHAWEQEKLTGYGYGTTRDVFETFAWLRPGTGAPNVHNSYLQWLLEFGLLGAPVLLTLMSLLLVVAVRGGAYAPAVVTGFVIQAGESAMFGTGQPYPYIFWFAVLAACIRADGLLGVGDSLPKRVSSDRESHPTQMNSRGGVANALSR